MWIIDRYVWRELLAPFALGVTLFTFFLIIDRLFALTELVVTKGVPFHLVIQLLLFMLPSFLAHALPMALLVALLLAGGRLAGDLEIVAFQAAGVSPGRLLRPVVIAALVVGLGTAALTVFITPASTALFQRQLFRTLQSRAASALRERVFTTAFGDLVLYVEDMSPSQVALNGILVSDERDPKLTRIVTAREGRLLTDETTQRVVLRLMDGAINEADVAPPTPVRAAARPAGLEPPPPPAGGAATASRYRYTAFSLYDMSLSIDSPFRGTRPIEKPEKNFSMRELDRAAAAARAEGRNPAPYLVEFHKRFALPAAALVLALVGFPLATLFHRGGRSIALVGSLSILVSYYLILSSVEAFALSGRLPSWLAMWIPNMAFGAVAASLNVPRLRRIGQRATDRVSLLCGGAAAAVRRSWGKAEAHRRPWGARESTRIIDRYVLRTYLTYFAVGLAVAGTLFLIVDLLQTLDRYLRTKPPLVYILEHFLYRLPVALHDGLPVVTLVATLFLFLTLSRNHELTALKAAGVSLYRVSAPIVVFAVVTSIGAGLFQEFLAPLLNERGDEVDRVKIRGQAPPHLRFRSRIWLRSSDTRFFRVELLDPATHDLHGVTVLEIDRHFRIVNRLDAALAHWTSEGWEFSDGAIREIGADGQVQTVPFSTTALELPEAIDRFTGIEKPIEAMSFTELRAHLARLAASGYQVRKYLVELYARLAFPLAHLVTVLVAIPFALLSPRGGRLFGAGLAIAILAAYLVVHYSAVALARADLLPPMLAAWTANIVFTGIGGALLLRART
jgi:LPS export ABC transporter permease LptG